MAAQVENKERIERFEYPVDPDAPEPQAWNGWMEPEVTGPAPHHTEPDQAAEAREAGMRAGFEQRLVEETRRSFEAGRERGLQEGRQAEREAHAAADKAAEEQRARQSARLIESFAQERDRYLRAVEHEVVELALAVAARILRREAQMDPLLLTGVVRVALGQLSESTRVRLRVPAPDLDLWKQTVALLPTLAVKPEVVAGDGMRIGDCVIETEQGSVDLGIRSQLGEIERGFFDRAGRRKAEPAADLDNFNDAPTATHESRP